MKLTFDNLVVKVEEATDAERAWLFDFLSFSDVSLAFRGKVKRFRIFNLITDTFPSGNLGSVIREWHRLNKLAPCSKCGDQITIDTCPLCVDAEVRPKWLGKFEIKDTRTRPCAIDPQADIAWLYWYQREAVSTAAQRGRGIIKIPTAGGKTEVFVALTRMLPCRWLFIAHRAQLMINGSKRWLKRERERIEQRFTALAHAEAGGAEVTPEMYEEVEQQLDALRVGMYGDGNDDVRDDDRVVFATFQGLYAGLAHRGGEILRWAQAVCIDECHVQPADTFFKVTQSTPNAYYRIGLSGTPLQRGDRRNVLAIGALGKVVYKIKVKTLIDEGVYAKPMLRFVTTENANDIPPSTPCKKCEGTGDAKDVMTGDMMPCSSCKGTGVAKQKYPTIYKHGIVQSKIRNAKIVEVTKRASKPCMLFVEKRDHGKILKASIERAGINVRFVDGTKNTEAREKAISDLARGHIDVIITTRIMQEGIDLPSLASVINAGAGKSMIGVLQRIGRGARTTASKTSVEMWDFFDADHPSLRRQANERKKALAEETECLIEMIPAGAPLPLLG